MIRVIEVSDVGVAGRLLGVQRAAYAVEAGLIGFDGIPALREDLEGLMASQERWLGRFVGDVLVGAVAFELPDEGTVEITRLVVDPAYSRQGHGRALLDELEVIEPRAVALVSTGTKNAPAVALYEGRGFEELGRVEVAPGVEISRFRRLRGL